MHPGAWNCSWGARCIILDPLRNSRDLATGKEREREGGEVNVAKSTTISGVMIGN